uniref:Uncharacterized protein n=1 Tax=Caenorhabditis japonica TaxID=281687 RepID=A0A8R1ISR2_CAEJA
MHAKFFVRLERVISVLYRVYLFSKICTLSHEGKKQKFIEELRTIAGTELSHVVDFLEDAPYGSKAFSTAKAYKTENSKRAQWTIK